jgi:hypothetical protein
MLILLLTGCFFTDTTPAPAPAPVVDEEPVVVEPEPVTVAATLMGTPDPMVIAQSNETIASQLASAKATFDGATTVAQVAQAYKLTITACNALTEFRHEDSQMDVDAVAAAGPGMAVSWQAEGTAAVFVPTNEAWMAKAATTPGDADDAFFAMTDYVYDDAAAAGWTVWEMRNWDYGGCGGLGTGVVLESMKRLQAAATAGDSFAAPIAQTREAALREITRTGDSQFQRCDVQTVQPMADDKLQGEVQQILDTIELTDAERAALVDAKPKLHGEVFQGG